MPKRRLALILTIVIVAAAVTVWAFHSVQGGDISPVSIAIAIGVALIARLILAKKAP